MKEKRSKKSRRWIGEKCSKAMKEKQERKILREQYSQRNSYGF